MLVFLILVMSMVNRAQVPQKIAYQAVIRNANGAVIASEQVQVQVKFHKSVTDGEVVYSENHTVTSTQQGLVSLQLGAGAVVSGSFSAIPWNENIFIEVLVKRSSETSFTSLGTSQIVSVPYAFLANSALTANNAQNGIVSFGNPSNTVVSTGAAWEPTARVSIMDSTVIISPKEGHDPEKPIFAVTNSQGQVVMAVYESGVRFFVEASSAKGAKGGFAVGGLTGGKAPAPTYFQLEPGYAQFLFDQTTKGAKGGFAVGGLTGGKVTDTLNYMIVHPDSIRLAFNQTTKGAKGGFAVGGLTNGKSMPAYYLTVQPEQTKVLFDSTYTSIKGAKGGFAVGGLTNGKAIAKDYFAVTPDSTYIVNTMVSYSDMVVAGTVTTNVGMPEPPLIDIDGNTYRTVKIGTQVWMAENLKTTKYSDGTSIPPTHFYSPVNPDSLTIFGNLYGDTVVIYSGKNVCPDGWHVPNQPEWETLFAFVGGLQWSTNSSNTFQKIVERGALVDTGIYNWWEIIDPILHIGQIPINVQFTSNETGFSARGAGSAYWDMPYFSWYLNSTGMNAYFWVNSGIPQIVNVDAVDAYSGQVSITEGASGNAYSIRCIKN